MEYRIFDTSSTWRYRNEVKASLKGIGKVTPYLSTEAFFNSEPFQYARERSYLGAKWSINQVDFDLYSCWQASEGSNGSWNHLFVVGTAVGFGF